MKDFIFWYLLISLIGFTSIPLANRLFRFLPGKGYGFIRPLGLLLVAYIFWLFTSFQIFQNSPGGIIFALIIYILFNLKLFINNKQEILSWIADKKSFIIFSELLFLLAFSFWAYVRACSPDIIGTEKPMELAFINSILKSPVFPPHDPWLSGYAISYYYFGYVMVALMTSLLGTQAGVAFNISIALWFAFTALSAYDLVFELLEIRRIQTSISGENRIVSKNKNLVPALLAPFYILIVSNLEGFLEMLHAKGFFWFQNLDGTFQSGFWKWLNISELDKSPTLPFSWIPSRMGGIWWWRASRVLQDFDLTGQAKEIIDEFPFFSYYLADLHPHVLAMPFAVLIIALSLNLYIGQINYNIFKNSFMPKGNIREWLIKPYYMMVCFLKGLKSIDILTSAIILGGLAFINTWDFPIYVIFFVASIVLSKCQTEGWKRTRIIEFLGLAGIIGIVGILLYLPFYLGFSSQAGGVLPSLSFFTRGVYLWIMFGTLLTPIMIWVIYAWINSVRKRDITKGLKITGLVIGGLWGLSYLLGWVIVNLPLLGNIIINSQGETGILSDSAFSLIKLGDMFLGLHGTNSGTNLFFESFISRFVYPGTWITLCILGSFIATIFIQNIRNHNSSEISVQKYGAFFAKEDSFTLLLVLTGFFLVLFPEYFYLRDQFGWRMNTIFKFYFQAWIIWGLAATYSIIILWSEINKNFKILFRFGWIFLLLFGLAYPTFNLWNQLIISKADSPNLDGMKYFQQSSPEEWEAILWLGKAPLGVVSEAVGGSYSGYARVSTNSGQPTILGWPGHEAQWRGGGIEIGNREADIQKLYKTSDWVEAKSIIKAYNIKYVYIGNLERNTYRANENKFSSHLYPVFQKGDVAIYDVTEILQESN